MTLRGSDKLEAYHKRVIDQYRNLGILTVKDARNLRYLFSALKNLEVTDAQKDDLIESCLSRILDGKPLLDRE